MVSGNFIWEVPSANYGVQFSERVNREVSIPLTFAETLVSMGYARRVEHDIAAHRLDCWVPTEKGREHCLARRRRTGLSMARQSANAAAKL